jgi:hypothetical protein
MASLNYHVLPALGKLSNKFNFSGLVGLDKIQQVHWSRIHYSIYNFWINTILKYAMLWEQAKTVYEGQNQNIDVR